MTGSDSAFDAIWNHIVKGSRPERREDLVNVFILPSTGAQDMQHMAGLLARIGLTANFVPYFCSLAGLRALPSAALCTTICSAYGDELIGRLNEEHGIPFTKPGMPMGGRETEAWLMAIAERFGLEARAEAVLEEERERYLPKIAEVRREIGGKRVLIVNNLMRGICNAALARDLGLEVAAVQSAMIDPFLGEGLAGAGVGAGVPVTFNGAQPYEAANLAKRLGVDLILGMGVDLARKLGVPGPATVDRLRCTCGYKGLLSMGRKFAGALSNTNFERKLAARKPLPYRESWYAEDPFKFIREDQ